MRIPKTKYTDQNKAKLNNIKFMKIDIYNKTKKIKRMINITQENS